MIMTKKLIFCCKSSTSPKGHSSKKFESSNGRKKGIIEKLVPLMPINKGVFSLNLPENENSKDLGIDFNEE